ncbi:hypothetical protein SeMB42_g03166 [Synchytrium endobioticum]|uniref:F5/8 type C domain-containing protein n=1 Tax=Synchytrium endobioticum TaxID=286115 RepID=A0A507D9B2_9FUNG|nr:hypothetical protein SeMB42_g03166 [Synchytrium endobioticum]
MLLWVYICLVVLCRSVAATIDWRTDLPLDGLAKASSTSQVGACANNTCAVENAIDDFDDDDDDNDEPDTTIWVSAVGTSCEDEVLFEVDWSHTYGPRMLGAVRILWGDRSAGRTELFYKLPDSSWQASGLSAVFNMTDRHDYFHVENSGYTPTAIGLRLRFTELHLVGAPPLAGPSPRI